MANNDIRNKAVTSAAYIGAGLLSDALFEKTQSMDIDRFAEGRFDKALETRGYLAIYSNNEKFILPFFENPKISESRSADYAVHKIYSKNMPIRMWTHTKNRKIDLEITYTVPHMAKFIYTHIAKMSYDDKLKVVKLNDTMARILRYDLWANTEDWGQLLQSIDPSGQLAVAKEIADSNDIISHTREYLPELEQRNIKEIVLGRLAKIMSPIPDDIQVYMQHFLELVRSTVVGIEDERLKTISSPPIVRLMYGTSYRGVPCVVTDYKFKIDDKSTFDNRTLLPQVMTFNFTLEEIEYNPTTTL